LSVEFIAEYNSRVEHVKLQKSALDILKNFKKRKLIQVIVSAMEQRMLEKLLEKHHLSDYFSEVRGLTNIYAGGKVHLAQSYINENNINPEDILLIGDTLHDAEVAMEIGCKLILVTNGHHSANRLEAYSKTIINDLRELNTIFN
jgi:phosphoglycolate phosphatase